MKIALFSDVHGRLRMVLHLIRSWQLAHRTYLDGTLIAGDMGCFPNPSKLDKATRRWMESDPEEAGFSTYFTQAQAAVEKMLRPEYGEFSDVRCPIFFVPGNHEDYDFIDAKQRVSGLKNTFAVDCYQRFHCIKDGAIICIQGQDGNCLRIAGIWGIENTSPQAPYKIKQAVIQQLESHGQRQFDLLLTHDAPAEAYPRGGSKLVARVIKACQPDVHLFGHVHPVNGQHEFFTPNVHTKSVILKGLSFGKNRDENLSGSMGIMEWDGSNSRIGLVTDDWLKQMRHKTWEQIWPEVAIEV